MELNFKISSLLTIKRKFYHLKLTKRRCFDEELISGSVVEINTCSSYTLKPVWTGVLVKENLLEKSVKRPFVLFPYCRCTSHICVIYPFAGISFYRKSEIKVKRKPNYEIGWFHNWPMIISHRLYAFHFTNDDFPL